MSNAYTSHSSPSSAGNPFSSLMPPSALPYIVVLLVIFPLAVLTGESFVLPLFSHLNSMVFPEMEGMRTVLPFRFFLKFALYLLFVGIILGQLLLRIRQAYVQEWVKHFERPDPLHLDYAPHPVHSVGAIVRWHGYRLMVVFSLPLFLMAATGLFGLFSFSLMNQVMDLSTISLPAAITVFLFVGLMLCLFTGVSIVNSIWLFISTPFGDMVALTETDLLPRTVFERCRRIAFSSPWVWVLYPLNGLFWLSVIGGIVVMMVFYDIQDLISFHLPLLQLLLTELAVVVAYIVLNYFTLLTYHDALSRYYHSLPPAFRDRFTIPD